MDDVILGPSIGANGEGSSRPKKEAKERDGEGERKGV